MGTRPRRPHRDGLTVVPDNVRRATCTGERDVRDSAGRGDGLDVVVLLEALEPVPETHASAEQDRDDDDVHVIDEPGSKELPDRGGAAADAYVLIARGVAGR